ncbi:MAG: hypothetical protein ACRDZO_29335 [Egibacteraceae bacterium]
MPFVAWVTLLIAALIIGAIAVALTKVIIDLKHVSYTLATVIVGVRAIALQTSTVPAALTSVNANLKPVRDFCETV